MPYAPNMSASEIEYLIVALENQNTALHDELNKKNEILDRLYAKAKAMENLYEKEQKKLNKEKQKIQDMILQWYDYHIYIDKNGNEKYTIKTHIPIPPELEWEEIARKEAVKIIPSVPRKDENDQVRIAELFMDAVSWGVKYEIAPSKGW